MRSNHDLMRPSGDWRCKEDIEILADTFVHLDLRRLHLGVREHESDGVAAALTLEEDKCREKSNNQTDESTELGRTAREATTYRQNY
jgi:hypothetical protein